MPNKTIYVKDADLPLLEQAQEQLGDSVSSMFAQFLRERVATLTPEETRIVELINKITAAGIPAIVATVGKGESWLDHKECIVLDYSKTSLVAQWIRDEIRLIGPNFYLGKVYWGKDRLIDFCLQF